MHDTTHCQLDTPPTDDCQRSRDRFEEKYVGLTRFHEAGVDCEAGEVSHTMRRCQNEYQRILEDVHVVDVPSGILI